MKNNRWILLGMSLTALFWGASFTFIKLISVKLSSNVIIFWRFAIAAVVMYCLWKVRAKGERIKKEDLFRVIVNGLLGGVFYYMLSNLAIVKLPVVGLSVVSAMQPIFMLIIETLFIGTLFSARQSFFIALSVIGGIMTIENVGSGDSIGYLLQGIATVAWCAYYVIQRPLVRKYYIETILFYQSLVSCIVLFPIVLFDPTFSVRLNGMELVALGYLGVFCIGFGYYANSYALRTMSPTVISLFLNIGTILNVLLSYTGVCTMKNGSSFLGIVLVLLGAYGSMKTLKGEV